MGDATPPRARRRRGAYCIAAALLVLLVLLLCASLPIAGRCEPYLNPTAAEKCHNASHGGSSRTPFLVFSAGPERSVVERGRAACPSLQIMQAVTGL